MRWLTRTSVFCMSAAQLLMGSSAHAEGVQVALAGATSVLPGQTFEMDLVVPQAGAVFNGYDATIAWDPSKLTFVAAFPLHAQEGSYMTLACGATYHSFHQYATNVQITHAIWCAGMLLPGPGQLYRLRFRAMGAPGTTQVTIAQNKFYAAGYTVPTASASPATVVIGDPSDVATAGEAMRLDAVPNPFKPMTTLTLQAPESGQQMISVHDVAGRLVRDLDRGFYGAGPRQLRWDGRDNQGHRLASGAYWVTLDTGSSKATTRVVLLR